MIKLERLQYNNNNCVTDDCHIGVFDDGREIRSIRRHFAFVIPTTHPRQWEQRYYGGR